ncbi:MAG: DUF3018 family protein [Gammaproteobacteria bacterium]|nr:MAG: DUF3018 family protein [Gammaproteobacteria bacterium]
MSTTAERVRRHREKMRACGLRPIQLWVPDTRRQDFREACRRQSLLLHDDPQEKEILEWLEQVTDTTGWK